MSWEKAARLTAAKSGLVAVRGLGVSEIMVRGWLSLERSPEPWV